MKVWYIHHSSFLVESETCCLLFDYVQGELPEVDTQKPLYVFASHRHGDHFSPEIFKLSEGNLRVTYILSDDIWRKRVPKERQDQTRMVGPGEKLQIGPIQVETLRSTDEGVAFWLNVDGHAVYHAGDLNDWRWEGEQEEANAAMTKAYREQIDRIAGRHADLAFVVLDPRQGKDYDRGIRYFLEQVKVDRVFAMHWWGDDSVIEKCRGEAWTSPFRKSICSRETWAVPRGTLETGKDFVKIDKK